MKKVKNPKYVKPTSDIGFHWVFCKEGNDEVVLQLLNACIREKEIVSFERLETEHCVNADTMFRFDLYCKCSDGSRIIVECQNWSNRENFAKRALAYSSMAIVDQLKPRLKFDYSKIYFVGLLNYNQFPGRSQAITNVRLYTEGDYVLADDNYLQIYVELRKLPRNPGSDFSTLFLSAVRDIGKGERAESAYNDERLRPLLNAANFGSMPSDKQEEYKKSMTTEDDIREYWEEQVSDAKAEGLAEGLAEGKAETQMEIARRLKSMGLTVEQITVATSLSVEEVAGL